MKITLKKIPRQDLVLIQSALLVFLQNKIDTLSHYKDYQQYCNDIILIDLVQELYLLIRTKLERNAPKSNLVIQPSVAVVLLYCSSWKQEEQSQELRHTMQRLAFEINEKLINL